MKTMGLPEGRSSILANRPGWARVAACALPRGAGGVADVDVAALAEAADVIDGVDGAAIIFGSKIQVTRIRCA